MNDLNIKIKGIFLLATNFIRGHQINFDRNEESVINTKIEIGYEFSDNNKNIGVMFSYELLIPSETEQEKPQVTYSSVHFAQLDVENYTNTKEQNEYLKRYINVNVAAMIFPFTREHLATTTVKSGMPPILIPPVNFVERYKELINKD